MSDRFSIGDRALFNDGQQVTIEQVYNGGSAHGCYLVKSDTGATFTAHAPELGTIARPPAKPRPLTPGECRTIVRYDMPRARLVQRTPCQQQQAFDSRGMDAEAVRAYVAAMFPSAAASPLAQAFTQIAARDEADRAIDAARVQRTPCQQQQANAGAANDVLVDAFALIADAAATIAALPTCGEREVLTEIASLARAALAKVQS